MGAMTDSYAEVAWKVADISELRPDWTDEKCIDFLYQNEDLIQEAMIQRGWQAIEDLLRYEETEDKC